MKILDDFKEKGFSELEVPISKELLDEAVSLYREFDKHTSIEEKEKTFYRYSETSRVSYGYKEKSHHEGFDDKSYFHFHPFIIPRNPISHNETYSKFLESMQKIYSIVEDLIRPILLELDAKGILSKKDSINEEGNPYMNIRVLNYKPKSSCKMPAKRHTDRGLMTLTLYETDEGLSFVHEGKETEVLYKEGEGKLFPGDKWSLFSTIPLKGLDHQVTNKGFNKRRSSLVIFINSKVKDVLL